MTTGPIERTPELLSLPLPEGPLTRRVRVTSAELLALFATPKELVPAPAAGFALDLDRVYIHKPAGVAYAGIAAGEDLKVSYTNGAGLEVARFETTGFLDSTAKQTRVARGYAAASGINDFTPTVAAALVLSLLIAEIITGDSDLDVLIKYHIVPDAVFV